MKRHTRKYFCFSMLPLPVIGLPANGFFESASAALSAQKINANTSTPSDTQQKKAKLWPNQAAQTLIFQLVALMVLNSAGDNSTTIIQHLLASCIGFEAGYESQDSRPGECFQMIDFIEGMNK